MEHYVECTAIIDWLEMQEWNVITGIASVVIALCALFYTIWAGWRTHIHNKLSVKPHLSTWITTDSDRRFYSVELINNGIGPALIERFEVKVDGEILQGNATEPVEKAIVMLFPDCQYKSTAGLIGRGYSMAVNERRSIATIHFSKDNPPPNDHIISQIKRCAINVTYKSFYGDEYTYSSANDVFL
jgi:hypothetical protein